MSEYRYIKEFYLITSIKKENIIVQEVDIKEWGTVYIYIVEKKDGIFIIYKTSGSADKPIDFSDIHYITLAECEVKELFQKIQ